MFALFALVCVCVCARSDGYPQSYQYHNYSGSPEEGVRDMLRAGLDVDCAFGSGIALDAQTVSSALRMGVITEADIETALEHLFMVRVQNKTNQNKPKQNRTKQNNTMHAVCMHTMLARSGSFAFGCTNRAFANTSSGQHTDRSEQLTQQTARCFLSPLSSQVRMRLGHFDPNGALQEIPEAVICSAEHAVTAREGAIQGSTLLKNSAKTLPLKASALKVVAVIGPNADLSKAIAGYYGSGDPCKVRLEITLLNTSQSPFLVAMRCYFLHS